MLYFIPDWSGDSGELLNDPLVSLAHLFQSLEEPFQILFLFPDNKRRCFLNRNSLLKTHYWSALDTALGIKMRDGMGLTIDDLSLPKQAELRYSVYGISVISNNSLYATIKFSSDGYVSEIQYARQLDGTIQSDLYDDRGFRLSKSVTDEDGNLVYQKWFNEYGQCVLTETTDGINVTSFASSRFSQPHYDSLKELLAEMTINYLDEQRLLDEQVKLITTVNSELNFITTRLQKKFPIAYFLNEKILSNDQQLENTLPLIYGAKKIFVRDDQQLKKLRQLTDDNLSKTVQIAYPFSTTLALGQSNEMDMKNIVWAVGEKSQHLQEYLTVVMKKLLDDKKLCLVFIKITFNQRLKIIKWILEWALNQFSFLRLLDQKILIKALMEENFDQVYELLSEFGDLSEIKQLQSEQEATKISVEYQLQLDNLISFLQRIHFKLDFNRQLVLTELNQARVLVDLSSYPDSFLQTTGISMGIPQLNSVLTPYIEPPKNGWIVTNSIELTKGLIYFLDSLKHWNESLVESVTLIERFSADSLRQYWKGQLDGNN